MSLINDALKRAKQAHTENPAPTPDLPFRAAEPSQNRNPGFPVLPVAVVVIALVLGGGLIFLALQNREAAPQVVHATEPGPTSPSLATTTPLMAMPAVTPVGQGTPGTTVAAQVQAGSTPSVDSASGSTPEAPSDPEPAKSVIPKLQGIFYSPNRPAAVLNGKTVYVGSRVGEAKDFVVLNINRDSVTVANGSQTNLLLLEE